jgi:uncharacterized membrane protein YdbT with pleckstrin-like domain
MSYVKHILQQGERVLAIGRIHRIIYAPAMFYLACAAAAFGASVHFKYTDVQWLAWTATFIFLLFGIVAGFRAWWRRFTTEIAVTTTRVIYKTGFIDRYTNEMNIDKVESVVVDQSIPGRIFGYGTIFVRGTGANIERLKLISHVIELRNAITSR